MQFVGVFACASLCCALFAFGIAGGRNGRAMTAAAFALVMVATFTMANGLLVGPVLVALAVLGRANRATVLAAAAVTTAAAAAFFADHHPGSDGGNAADLPRVLAFAAGYLGTFAPFGLASRVALGACGLVAAAAIAGDLALRDGMSRDARAARLALLGIALFAAGSALATAVGRSGSGLVGVGSSRYATGAAVFWAATVIGLWSWQGGRAARVTARLAAASAAFVLIGSSSAVRADRGIEMDRRAAQYDAMADAMLLGLYDVPALDAFEEPVDLARAMEDVLRRRRLSIFGTRDAGLVGRPVSEAAAPGAPPLACAGSFTSAVADPALGRDGVAAAGTSGLRQRLGRPGRVYLADGDGQVVGFAHAGPGGGRWAGYARARPGAALAAWAVSDAGRPCRLGSATVAGPEG